MALIGFMVVAHQMKHAMKDEDAYFLVEGAAVTKGVPAGDIGRDGDVTKVRLSAWDGMGFGLGNGSIGWKGQYIGRAIFA
ncbi:MAG: hypothetical protein WA673_16015, partial [Candidatus Acidiferrales bacterium]